MGAIKINIRNISSPNDFIVSYKSGNSVGNVNDNFIPYGTTYTGGTTELSITGLDLKYGEQYWIKIEDLVNGSFIIENIYIHENNYFKTICP